MFLPYGDTYPSFQLHGDIVGETKPENQHIRPGFLLISLPSVPVSGNLGWVYNLCFILPGRWELKNYDIYFQVSLLIAGVISNATMKDSFKINIITYGTTEVR